MCLLSGNAVSIHQDTDYYQNYYRCQRHSSGAQWAEFRSSIHLFLNMMILFCHHPIILGKEVSP